jgi:hypothetical protein
MYDHMGEKREEKKIKQKKRMTSSFFLSLPTIHSILEHILHFTNKKKNA